VDANEVTEVANDKEVMDGAEVIDDLDMEAMDYMGNKEALGAMAAIALLQKSLPGFNGTTKPDRSLETPTATAVNNRDSNMQSNFLAPNSKNKLTLQALQQRGHSNNSPPAPPFMGMEIDDRFTTLDATGANPAGTSSPVLNSGGGQLQTVTDQQRKLSGGKMKPTRFCSQPTRAVKTQRSQLAQVKVQSQPARAGAQGSQNQSQPPKRSSDSNIKPNLKTKHKVTIDNMGTHLAKFIISACLY
jgi:hypothetical protein